VKIARGYEKMIKEYIQFAKEEKILLEIESVK